MCRQTAKVTNSVTVGRRFLSPSRSVTEFVTPAMPDTISLDTAASLMGVAKRTLQRRIGEFARFPNDARGRTTLDLDQVLEQACIPFEDRSTLLRADAGEPEAQNDLAMLFLAAGRSAGALYWLELAAAQEHADAMQHLARHHLPTDLALGVMWLARAASAGHVIAGEQLRAMVGRAAPRP